MSPKGETPPLEGLHQKRWLDILCEQERVDEGAARASIALIFALTEAEGGGRIPSR